MAFVLSSLSLLLAVVGVGLSRADDKESPLEKLMEKVGKQNSIAQKGTRNAVFFKKGQKDVAASAKELAKLGEEARPIDSALKNAKDVKDPKKKWEELMDEFIKTSKKLNVVAAKDGAAYQDAKDAFTALKKSCSDCHTVFKAEEN
jgi:cytochrome c556